MRRHTMIPSKAVGSNSATPTSGAVAESDGFAFPERVMQKESAIASVEKTDSTTSVLQSVMDRQPKALERVPSGTRSAFDREAGGKEAAVAAVSPVPLGLSGRTKSGLLSPISTDSNTMDSSSAPAVASPPSAAPALNFSDPDDRAAMLKEALARKAMSRRKSSVM